MYDKTSNKLLESYFGYVYKGKYTGDFQLLTTSTDRGTEKDRMFNLLSNNEVSKRDKIDPYYDPKTKINTSCSCLPLKNDCTIYTPKITEPTCSENENCGGCYYKYKSGLCSSTALKYDPKVNSVIEKNLLKLKH